MITRNSIVSPAGFRYFLVSLQNMAELLGDAQPPCLTQDGQGIILIYNDIIIDAYGEDKDFDSHSPLLKNLGYQTMDESTYGYFSWEADEPIHINHDSPYIFWDSTNGEAATEGLIITKLYSGEGDSPFKGTDVKHVQSTASTNAVVRGGASYFEGCTKLEHITMHNATWFGDRCFYGCTSLSQLNLSRKACTFGTDCFGGGAGVVRGEIYAEGLTGTTEDDKWVWEDVPAELQDKHWIVRNYESDGSEYSDYYRVETWAPNEWTITPNPAFTQFAGVEGNFAEADTSYALTVGNIQEGQTLEGWGVGTWATWEDIVDTSNPRSFTFSADTYLEARDYIPEKEVKPIEPEK